jgi:hypothetical protein
MKNLADMLTPKRIIFDAIKSKLEPLGIIRLVLVFNVKTDTYNVMFSNGQNERIKIDIDEQDTNMIKKVFINSIRKKVDQEFKRDYKTLTFIFDLPSEKLEIWIEDIFETVEQFNY